VILEGNAEPTIAFHFPPLCDRYRPVCEAIIESLFPAGQTGRIPLAVITGGGDRARIGRWLAELLRESGRGIGRASGEGLYFQRERLKPGDQANLPGSRAALLCPEVDVAVLERELTSIRHEGLGLDRVDVAILSCLGRSDPSLDVELERAARVLVAATAPTGAVVIEADDPTAAAIAQSFVGTVVVVSDPERPLPGAGRAPAHAAVCLRDSHLVVATRDGTEQVVALDPWVASELATSGHRCGLLAAVGAAWAMGIPVDAIAMRIESALREGAI
jgi:cyanophycin synthetase